jgi:hypothetical protein
MLMLRPGRVRAVLDTDTYNEIDDQFALVQAMLSPDRIVLEAIYAAPFHNKRSSGPGDGMDKSYDEILRLLDRMGRSPAGFVFKGVRDFVGPAKEGRKAEAVDHLIARARASSPDDPLSIIAIAAISNVASALLAAPDIADKVIVVWLGGHALEWPDTREFNLRQDVGGAQVVLDSGAPLVLIPCMGVTSHLHSTVPEIERWVEPQGKIGKFLAERFTEYSDDHFGWSKEIWDMAPVGWLINPDWVPTVLAPTPILTDQATWSVDRTRPPMRYATIIKRDPILRDFFSKLKLFAARGETTTSQRATF